MSKRNVGAIAQLVEHLHGMQGASGSSPLGSIGTFAIYTNYFERYLYYVLTGIDKVFLKNFEKNFFSWTI